MYSIRHGAQIFRPGRLVFRVFFDFMIGSSLTLLALGMQETSLHAAWAVMFSFAITAPVFAAEPVYYVKSWQDVSDDQLSAPGKQILKADRERWLVAESQHFVGYAYSRRDLDALIRQSEFAYDEINKFLGLPSSPPKTQVFQVQNEKLWNNLLRGAGFRPDGLAFHYENEIFLKADAAQGARPDRVPHEIVHARLHRAYGADVPLWLDEGLANVLGWRVAVAYARGQAKALTRNHEAMDPARVMNLSDLSAIKAYPDDPVTAGVYYREVEEVIAAVADKLGDERMLEFIRAVCQDKSGIRETLKSGFGYSDENLERLEDLVRERTISERSL
jgi:hypothetical protein